MMMEDSFAWVAVAALEAGLVGGLVFVGLSLGRLRVNGPCRVCLATLFAWRVSVMVSTAGSAPGWDYLWGALFAYVFLYATHHLGAVTGRAERRVISSMGRQATRRFVARGGGSGAPIARR